MTERGPVNEPILVGSWPEYQRTFGGLLADNIFPFLCKRALERGARLKVARFEPAPAQGVTVTPSVNANGTMVYPATTGVNVDFEAANPGAWGNGITVEVSPALSGNDNRMDIKVTLNGYPDLGYTVRDIFWLVDSANNAAIIEFNTKSPFVKIVEVSAAITAVGEDKVTLTLADGTSQTDDTVYSAAQWIGGSVTKTGINTFDGDKEISKLS